MIVLIMLYYICAACVRMISHNNRPTEIRNQIRELCVRVCACVCVCVCVLDEVGAF